MNKPKSYIIYAPAYSGSAGVRVLYSLRQELEKRGYQAKVLMYSEGRQPFDDSCYIKSIDEITEEIKNNDIVIYPEVIYGNPLGFRNVVRYVLNSPGVLDGQKHFHKGELIVSWDKSYYDNVPFLTFNTVDENIFYKSDAVKDVNCYFVYKNGKFRDVPEIKDCIKIDMSWPETKEELANLLRRTNILYSFDDHTSLADEAIYCGAKVKIIKPDKIEDFKLKTTFDKNLFEAQITNFIELSQQMNYTGKINIKGCLHHCICEKVRLKCLLQMYKILAFITKLEICKSKVKQVSSRIKIWKKHYAK